MPCSSNSEVPRKQFDSGGATGLPRRRNFPCASPMETRTAKFGIGQVVGHRIYPFRGVIFDVDPTFANSEEWWRSIPAEARPSKDQPFYHLYAENADSQYIAMSRNKTLSSTRPASRCATRSSTRP